MVPENVSSSQRPPIESCDVEVAADSMGGASGVIHIVTLWVQLPTISLKCWWFSPGLEYLAQVSIISGVISWAFAPSAKASAAPATTAIATIRDFLMCVLRRFMVIGRHPRRTALSARPLRTQLRRRVG